MVNRKIGKAIRNEKPNGDEKARSPASFGMFTGSIPAVVQLGLTLKSVGCLAEMPYINKLLRKRVKVMKKYEEYTEYCRNYDVHDDLVDELFHRQLVECHKMEDLYFREHDEYEILKEKFRNRKYGTTFGANIAECSDGRILVYKEKEDGNASIYRNEYVRDITIEELKELLAKCDQLEKFVEKLTAETHIVY